MDIKNIQAEEVISVQNQHKVAEQLISLIWNIHNQEFTSVGYHKHFLKIINRLSNKVSYVYRIIDPVIDGFSPNDESNHFHICDHSIVTFGIREKCIGF